jgi:hypothetical protein
MSGDVRVVYLVGTPRSGSTLLTSLLGQQPGWFAAGEIRLMWRELDTRRCGCGELATTCPVWSRVIDRVADTYGEPHHVADLMLATTRMASLPRIARADDLRGVSTEARRYAAVLRATYEAVVEVTGADVVVDSSKSVSEASLLRLTPGVDAYVAHTVRDPRAVAHSWRRAVARGATGTPDLPTWSIALRWVLTNTAAEVTLRGYRGRAGRVRYEDLAVDPHGQVAGIVSLVPAATTHADEAGAAAGHIVAGNQLRRQATVVVREDRAWVDEIDDRSLRQVSALTLPVRRHYGYVGGDAA